MDHKVTTYGTFPFGQPILDIEQQNREPKCVFVLGVYASAVHARWVGPDGKERIKAVGVASEPYIFWCGDQAKEIIARIPVPASVGRLDPAAAMYNGPSGTALDDLLLAPLKIDRIKTWLCDLVPHSCMNSSQATALRRAYNPLVSSGILPVASWPPVPSCLADDARRNAIWAEIKASRAKTVVLLGDEPIKWFLAHFDNRWTRLSDFGKTPEQYGRLHRVHLEDLEVDVLPVVHPRQAARLGLSDPEWGSLHAAWVENCPIMLDC